MTNTPEEKIVIEGGIILAAIVFVSCGVGYQWGASYGCMVGGLIVLLMFVAHDMKGGKK